MQTLNLTQNRREDFDYIDYAQQQPQRPLSPMVMNMTGGGGGGGGGYSDLTAAQGVYEGGGGWVGQQQQQQYQQQQYQQQPQQQEWLPAVLPSFCTVSVINRADTLERILFVVHLIRRPTRTEIS